MITPTKEFAFDDNRQENAVGMVVRVRGTVIDAKFDNGLPEINNELRIGSDLKSESGVIAEVVTQLDSRTIRCIALSPVRNVSRGTKVLDMQRPLTVPVDASLKGRMINVFGDAIDRGEPLAITRRKPILSAPPCPASPNLTGFGVPHWNKIG